MTHIQIIRRCPSCRSEDVEPFAAEHRDLATMRCRECGEKWSEPVLALGVTSDPLGSRLLKWRPRR